ncbi:unnamed protein product, partial [marine sediment metagenome]
CPVCNGAGKIAKDSQGRLDTSVSTKKTITCHGCGGAGWVRVA